jgi:protein O-mannosyl-transferase
MAQKRFNQPPTKPKSQGTKPLAQTVEVRPLVSLGQRNRLIIPSLILLGLSFALYFQSLSFGYVLDDLMVIEKNTYTQKGFGGLSKIFSEDSFTGYFGTQTKLLEGGRYRPLSLATFAAEIALFGPNKPFWGHFFNILSYWITALMLYLVLERIWPNSVERKWYFNIPFWSAVLFLLHPLHSEAVANIKGRDEILALFFSLAALWAALKHADGYGRIMMYLSAIMLFLGLLSKENTITFAAIIPLTLWYFKDYTLGRALKEAWPLYVSTFVFLVIRSKVLGYFLDPGVKITDLMNNPFVGMTVSERFATIFLTLGWYVKLLFVPNPLTHDYYPYHVPKVNWADWRAYGSLALYVVMIGVAFFQIRKKSVLSYAILFFIATTSVISNLFFSVGSFMNERFMFMPSVAFSLLTAWVLVDQLPRLLKMERASFNFISLALVVLIAGVYAFLTYKRVPEWKDGFTLNKTAIERSPNSARANCFIATAMYEKFYLKESDPEKKRELREQMDKYITRSLEINPNYGSAMTMKAGFIGEQFLYDHQAEKMFHEFEKILERKTNIPYIDEFMVYLVPRINHDKFTSFCHRMGYEIFFKQKRDFPNAVKYLEYGIKARSIDLRLLGDMIEVYQAQGNQAKVQEYQQKLEEAKKY